MDEGGDGGSQTFRLVSTDPDQEPTVILDASRESGAEASAGTDTNTPLVDGRRV